MDLWNIIKWLYKERAKLDGLIASLEWQRDAADARAKEPSPPKRPRGRTSMGAEERRQVAERMRRYVEPTDPDHGHLLERPVLAAKFVRVEKWIGDGVKGMSAIFLTEHVAGMDDAKLQNVLTEKGLDLSGW